MNKKLGLGFIAVLLSATSILPVDSSPEDRIKQSMQKELERNFLDSDQSSSELEAFEPSEEPISSTENSSESDEVISYFYEYDIDGTTATTLYVNQIPVFTFLSDDAVKQATELSDRINDIYRNNIDPETITAHWNEDIESYTINVGEEILLTMTENIILADTTDNIGEDTRQGANRLRRLLSGNTVDYLVEVEGEPEPEVVIPDVEVVREVRGVTSWYGPGFHGRRTANGEIFNQNALTAAHRTLPFNTMVRVTNLNNGRSVVVRINDRGPYAGRRILDLSAAAAQQIGMISSGVAPIRLEILR